MSLINLSHPSPTLPVSLVRRRYFETGLYEGDSMAEAARHDFRELIGVEFSSNYAYYCRGRFRADDRVKIYEGCSVDWLATLIADVPTTFWLDAHFTGDPLRSGMKSRFGECPLLSELTVITRFEWTVKPLVIIDDLHMFEPAFWNTPAAEPYNRPEWPTLEQIRGALSDYQVSTYNGVIYAF